MSFSDVDICNKALSILGVSPIASLTENQNSAIRLNYVYSSVRDAVLRSYAWPFARQIETLNQISNETVTGWDYLYAYPPKCMQIIKVFSDTTSTDPDPEDYKIFKSPRSNVRSIAADITPAYIEYTFQVVDSTQFDADFVEAFALKLAGEVAYVLTGSLELGPKLDGKFNDAISEAQRKSSTEQKKTDTRTSSYEDARG